MKILFLTSAHASNDDRIYYLQAKTLSENHEIKIFSTFGGESLAKGNLILEYNKTHYSYITMQSQHYTFNSVYRLLQN